MDSLNDKIAELESEIKAIKNANPGWASHDGALAAIAAKRNRIAGLEAQGQGKYARCSVVGYSSFHPLF